MARHFQLRIVAAPKAQDVGQAYAMEPGSWRVLGRAATAGDATVQLTRNGERALDADRQNLVNQVTFMRHQLEEKEGKKGFGQPPCWVDNAGKAQRLIAVEVTEHGLVARPGWPAERAADAKKVPNLDALLAGGKPQSAAAFRAAALPILEWGRKRSPECRLYASVTVSATTVDTSVTGQNAVFDHFFPYGRVTVRKQGR